MDMEVKFTEYRSHSNRIKWRYSVRLYSKEILEETERAPQSLKGKYQSVDLDDSLFESLVPLVDCEIVPEGLSFDDIFTEEDTNPPSLLSPIIFDKPTTSEASLNPYSSDINGRDDSVFDILNSYSLDDLYQLLADSPQQNCSSGGDQECSMLIQGNDMDLLGMIHSYDSGFGATTPQKGSYSLSS
ncbi:hypothetical protein Bca52824_031482 [Brassica carinata]|uniref:Uncharacterized protein n=1 Tax=Brassica carinata TaxID=52824 RepID=A0A8X7SAP4_BRACI|nr:hypothetical protein Bca52824_031482 [Brassica carinata]